MMKKYFLILTALVLTACTATPHKSQLNLPQQIEHNKQVYQLASQQDLDSMAHYVYLLPSENIKNWQSAVDILLDRNEANWSLQQRIDVRTRVFKNTDVRYFQFEPSKDDVFAYVLYEPSEKNKDWQVDVLHGKQMARCGYVEYKYSLKVPKSDKMMNMNSTKVASYLQKYVIDKELQFLRQSEWTLQCLK